MIVQVIALIISNKDRRRELFSFRRTARLFMSRVLCIDIVDQRGERYELADWASTVFVAEDEVRLDREIGVGTTSTVWKGTLNGRAEHVAIKVLNSEPYSDNAEAKVVLLFV